MFFGSWVDLARGPHLVEFIRLARFKIGGTVVRFCGMMWYGRMVLGCGLVQW